MTPLASRLRHWLGRRAVLLLAVGLMTLFYAIADVTWHARAVGLVFWNRYYEKFEPAPDLADLTSDDKIILFWTPFFGHLKYNIGYGRNPFENCTVRRCVTTNRRSLLRNSSAVIFHPVEFSDLDLPSSRRPDQLWTFYMLESPPNTGAVFTQHTKSMFNVTMSYRRDSDIVSPYFVVEKIPANERKNISVEDLSKRWQHSQRPVRLPWVVSNCRSPGQRETYVQELKRYIDVDIFGRCGPLSCSFAGGLLTPPEPDICYRHISSNYIFYLSLENSRCRDYITEKFFLALQHNLIPVVYGASRGDYEAIAPPDSFIHVEDFASVKDLAAYLIQLANDPLTLDHYTKWRLQYKIRRNISDSWCELCAKLHQKPAYRQQHDDINLWWHQQANCM